VLAAVSRQVPEPSLASEVVPDPALITPAISPTPSVEPVSVRVLVLPPTERLLAKINSPVPEWLSVALLPSDSRRSVVSPSPV